MNNVLKQFSKRQLLLLCKRERFSAAMTQSIVREGYDNNNSFAVEAARDKSLETSNGLR